MCHMKLCLKKSILPLFMREDILVTVPDRKSIFEIKIFRSVFILLLIAGSCSNKKEFPEELLIDPKPSVFNFPNTDRSDISNPYRYIAHAGGIYDGQIYTNSLEALNLSAEKGFKFFELDLIETSDNEIVAAHDWEYWRYITGYSGEIPPTLSVFKSIPLYGDLTPLCMTDIKDWFSSHNDSILITDKIEDYEKLAAEFPFHDRILVEVFSLQDYINAYNSGIRYPLLSVESARTSRHGRWVESFIIRNEVPLGVVSVSSIPPFALCIDLINSNNGFVFAYTSNDLDFLSSQNKLFGIYTDSIDFIKQINGQILHVSFVPEE